MSQPASSSEASSGLEQLPSAETESTYGYNRRSEGFALSASYTDYGVKLDEF